MQKWEYQVIRIDGSDDRAEDRMNAGGRLGWELVAVSVQFTKHFLYFKRPLPKNE